MAWLQFCPALIATSSSTHLLAEHFDAPPDQRRWGDPRPAKGRLKPPRVDGSRAEPFRARVLRRRTSDAGRCRKTTGPGTRAGTSIRRDRGLTGPGTERATTDRIRSVPHWAGHPQHRSTNLQKAMTAPAGHPSTIGGRRKLRSVAGSSTILILDAAAGRQKVLAVHGAFDRTPDCLQPGLAAHQIESNWGTVS